MEKQRYINARRNARHKSGGQQAIPSKGYPTTKGNQTGGPPRTTALR